MKLLVSVGVHESNQRNLEWRTMTLWVSAVVQKVTKEWRTVKLLVTSMSAQNQPKNDAPWSFWFQWYCTKVIKEWRIMKLWVLVVAHAGLKWSKNDESWSCWQAPKSRKKDTVSNCWLSTKLKDSEVVDTYNTFTDKRTSRLTRTDDEASRCWCQRPTRNKINDYAITITSRHSTTTAQ